MENNIGWLRERHPEWEGLSGIGACVVAVTEKGKTTTSVSYCISSITLKNFIISLLVDSNNIASYLICHIPSCLDIIINQ